MYFMVSDIFVYPPLKIKANYDSLLGSNDTHVHCQIYNVIFIHDKYLFNA